MDRRYFTPSGHSYLEFLKFIPAQVKGQVEVSHRMLSIESVKNKGEKGPLYIEAENSVE